MMRLLVEARPDHADEALARRAGGRCSPRHIRNNIGIGVDVIVGSRQRRALGRQGAARRGLAAERLNRWCGARLRS